MDRKHLRPQYDSRDLIKKSVDFRFGWIIAYDRRGKLGISSKNKAGFRKLERIELSHPWGHLILHEIAISRSRWVSIASA